MLILVDVYMSNDIYESMISAKLKDGRQVEEKYKFKMQHEKVNLIFLL